MAATAKIDDAAMSAPERTAIFPYGVRLRQEQSRFAADGVAHHVCNGFDAVLYALPDA